MCNILDLLIYSSYDNYDVKYNFIEFFLFFHFFLVNYILKLSIFPLFLCFFFFECPTSYYARQIYYKSRIIFMRIRFPLK